MPKTRLIPSSLLIEHRLVTDRHRQTRTQGYRLYPHQHSVSRVKTSRFSYLRTQKNVALAAALKTQEITDIFERCTSLLRVYFLFVTYCTGQSLSTLAYTEVSLTV